MTEVEILRQKCWDRALQTHGSAHVFEQRSNRFRNRLRMLTFFGIAVPATIGSVVLSSKNADLSAVLLFIAGFLGLVQLIGSIWSLVSHWDESYSYARESLTSNYQLSNKYQKMAENPPSDPAVLQLQFDLLEKEDHFRYAQDSKQGISEEEKRLAMRAGLRQFQRLCTQCSTVPSSLEPTDCGVCGDFKRRRL